MSFFYFLHFKETFGVIFYAFSPKIRENFAFATYIGNAKNAYVQEIKTAFRVISLFESIVSTIEDRDF